MAREGTIKRKTKRRTGIGSFILGSFFGFLMCLVTLVGLGAFIYYNVSIDWVNKNFNAGIQTGNEEIEGKTLNDLVNVTVNLANSLDTYTLNDLNKDFGVELPDEIQGISIKGLKNVPFSELADAAMTRLSNISADELSGTGLVDLSQLNFIFDKSCTYYYRDGALYRGETGDDKVCDVEFANGSITIGDFTKVINNDNSVDVMFKYLPLSQAMADFSSQAGEIITLQDLETEFSVELPKCLDSIDRTKPLGELANEINKIKVSDFLGYTYSETDNVYYLDNNNNGVYDKGLLGDDAEEITKMMNTLANFTIGNMSDGMNNLTVSDLFDTSSGIFALNGLADAKLDEIPERINTVITETSISELHREGILTINNYNEAKTFPGTSILLKDMTIKDIMNSLFI